MYEKPSTDSKRIDKLNREWGYFIDRVVEGLEEGEKFYKVRGYSNEKEEDKTLLGGDIPKYAIKGYIQILDDGLYNP